jgi:hypothetical protein
MAKVLLIILFPLFAQGEYRAYILAISKEGNTRQVLTNFDHVQYTGIHPLDEGETIELVDSWMCWGSQGEGVPICQDPKNPQPTSGSDDQNNAATY